LPSIVTRTGWFASLPESAVAHVRPESEVADIQKQLGNFLNDRPQFDRMGVEGKRRLYPAHAPETYVNALLNLAARVIEFRPHATAHHLARRAGEGMSSWIDVLSSDDPLRRVADEILVLTGESKSPG
jgi:hypothetical protein